VQVLHGVSFALNPGLVLGLLGENGAGKSTLMKIAAGYEQPSGGELRIAGQVVRFAGSREAEAAGVVLIHQEFNLAEHLTVAQNIFLGHERKRGWLLDDAAMRAGAQAVLQQVGLQVDPDTPVHRLIVGRKQPGRDREGARCARRPPADHGRADRDADARRDEACSR
jgi:ribose transport system ATP-binding protein